MKIDLSGKIAVVTGGTGQLGRVMVRTLAECGADVAVHYHSNEKMAEQLCGEVKSMGRLALAVKTDITCFDSVVAMQKKISAELGPADIIVNNALIQYDWKTVLDQPVEDYYSQFRSCVLHNIFMIKAFVPQMIEKKYGRVIGISTECVTFKGRKQSAYIAGKQGMGGVLQVLAKEVGEHNITVNQIAPGWTISDKDRQKEPPEQKDYAKDVPLKRRGTDQEIANVVAFISSDLASFISGAFIPVCGGFVMPV